MENGSTMIVKTFLNCFFKEEEARMVLQFLSLNNSFKICFSTQFLLWYYNILCNHGYLIHTLGNPWIAQLSILEYGGNPWMPQSVF